MTKKERLRLNLSELIDAQSWILLFSDSDETRKIHAKILSFTGDNRAVIESDDLVETELPLNVLIHYSLTTGFYKIEAVLRESKKPKKYLLEAEEEGVKIQERRFIRAKVGEEIKLAVLNRPTYKGESFVARIEDISAGGAKLKTDSEVFPGYFVELNFSNLPDFPHDDLISEILWANMVETEGIYEAGVHFICSEVERKKIAKYVEQKELKQ